MRAIFELVYIFLIYINELNAINKSDPYFTLQAKSENSFKIYLKASRQEK